MAVKVCNVSPSSEEKADNSSRVQAKEDGGLETAATLESQVRQRTHK